MEHVLSRKHNTEVNFVLGLQGNMSEMINKEAERHQDILVVNVLDSYMNLTLKSVFMLKYLSDISGLYESLQTVLKVHIGLKLKNSAMNNMCMSVHYVQFSGFY